MITSGSLFTGIGGFDKGFEQAGMTCAWQVETDDKCNGVLAHHWPNVRRYSDVRTVGKHNLEPVDVISGGFPCQDVSVAGKRKGLAGERSGLWFEFHRVLEELRPQWVVIENVPGLLSSNGGEDFAIILQGLAEIGYLSAWRVLDAQYYRVAQRRRRVFIVGSLGDGRAAQVLFEPESLSWDTAPRRQAGKELAEGVAASLRSGGSSKRGWIGDAEQGLVAAPLLGSGAGTSRPAGIANEAGYCVTAPLKASSPSRRGGGSWPIAEEFVVADPAYALAASVRGTGDGHGQGWNSNYIVAGTLTGQMQGQSNQWPPINEADNLIAHSLVAHHGRNCGEDTFVVFEEREGCEGGGKGPIWNSKRAYSVRSVMDQYVGEIYPTLRGQPNQGPGRMADDAAAAGMVRRLTPTECERLQGFPGGWTAVNGQSDSARYRQLGNAVCVPVAKWIGRRIAEVTA